MSRQSGGTGFCFLRLALVVAVFAACVGDRVPLAGDNPGGGNGGSGAGRMSKGGGGAETGVRGAAPGAGGTAPKAGGATPGAGGAAGASTPNPPTGGAGGAMTGSCAASYTDALPGLPPALVPPSSLAPGDGLEHARCRALLDNGSTSTSASRTEMVVGPGHARGRFYYEATVRQFDSGWSTIGVFALPDSVGDGPFAAFSRTTPTSAASVLANGTGVVGVAFDIDAAAVFFFRGGNLTDQRRVSRLPGVGPYSPAIVSMLGNAIDVNFGQAPFAFAIPEGYAAWASGLAVDGSDACVGDTVPPPPAAPITGICDSPKVSTFKSACGGDLVALGIYTTDQSNSTHSEGTTFVHIKRQGHITLGLSAYEPTHWVVDAVEGAVVDRILAYGYYTPRVDAPAGSALIISSERTTGGTQWPFDDQGDDTPGYIAALERDAGAPLSMFGGCYAATEFTIGD